MRWRVAVSLAIGMLVSLAGVGSAHAGSYTVLACDAAPGGISTSWPAQAGSVNSFRVCPTLGNPGLGMGTRLYGRTFGAGEYSRLHFFAAPGTTINGLFWGGRAQRSSCSWATQIRALGAQDQILVGYGPQGAGCFLDFTTTSRDFYRAPPGTTQLLQNTQCGAGSCPSGAAFHTAYAAVVVSDPTSPAVSIVGGGLAAGRWLRRSASVDYAAADNVGIREATVVVAGRAGGIQRPGCDFTLPKPGADARGSLGFATDQLADGIYPLQLVVADCAGNGASRAATVKVDNTPPARVRPETIGGAAWRSKNGFSVGWRSVADRYAPIVRARYLLCRAGGVCTFGVRDGAVTSLPAGLSQAGEYRLQVSLEDEAGNVGPLSDPAILRFDPEPPAVAFEAPNGDDPLRVSVRTADATSGVVGGEIELRRRGAKTWHQLETSLEGSHLVAYVDDERFGDGGYEFRARAVDRAGNERSTDRLASGARAGLQLPVRYSTVLRAGVRTVHVERKIVRRHGRRRTVRRRTVRYVAHRRVRLGRRMTLRGILTNRDGQPIDGATVDVQSRPRYGNSPFVPVGSARTNAQGLFSYIAKADASRVLRFRYAGTRQIRAVTREFVLAVPASSTIATSRRTVANGRSVVFAGKIRGGSIPGEGKVAFVQAVVRGQWRTFATPRTDRRGRWRFRYRFAVTRGVVRYRFRLCVPRETGYPFESGCSRPTTVTVRGS